MLNLRAAGSLALAVTVSIVVCTPATAQTAEPVEATPGTDANAAPPAADPSDDSVRKLTEWVVASGDNNNAPFIVIDKVAAKVFVYDSQNQLVGEAPALVGIAIGDDSAPGIGSKRLSAIPTHDRTTPAGRFVAKIGMESGNHEVLWIDYAAAISLHPVVTANRKERRLERLRSPTPDDNRITFGCINVPPAFYKEVVRPLFNKRAGIVYIIPETKALGDVFPMNLQVMQASATTGGSR